MRGHDYDCECRRCVMDREFRSEMANPANHTFDVDDLDDVTPLPPAPVVVRVTLLRCDGSHTAGVCHDPNCKFRNPARSRAKRRR